MAIYAKYFDLDSITTNIIGVLEQATEQEIEDGRDWYHQALSFSCEQAKSFKIPVKTVTAVISAISPESKWALNMERTIEILDKQEQAIVTTYDQNKSKALKFLYGSLVPDISYGLDYWPKTGAFYQNIQYPKQANRVTLDRHSLRIAHGYYLTAQESIYYGNTRAKYTKTEQVYKSLASRLGYLPNQLQAITWLTYRRIFLGNGQQAKQNREAYKPIYL